MARRLAKIKRTFFDECISRTDGSARLQVVQAISRAAQLRLATSLLIEKVEGGKLNVVHTAKVDETLYPDVVDYPTMSF